MIFLPSQRHIRTDRHLHRSLLLADLALAAKLNFKSTATASYPSDFDVFLTEQHQDYYDIIT